MPVMSTTASLSKNGFQPLNVQISAAGYLWLSNIDYRTNGTQGGRNIARTYNNNVYTFGRIAGAASVGSFTSVADYTGEMLTYYEVNNGSDNRDMIVDSAGNYHLMEDTGGTFTKYSSSGSFTNSILSSSVSSNSVLDNNYIYTVGIDGAGKVTMSKINPSSYSFVWSSSFSLSTYQVGSFCCPVADSSGNIYHILNTFGGTDQLVYKYDSSGNLQWQRNIAAPSVSSMNITGQHIAVDTSGNVYILIVSSTAGQPMVLVKLDTNGNFIAEKSISSILTDPNHGILINQNSQIIIYNQTSSYHIITLDSSLNILYHTQISFTGGPTMTGLGQVTSLDISSSNIYVTVQVLSTRNTSMIIKLPLDANITGVNTPFNFTVTTLGGTPYTFTGNLIVNADTLPTVTTTSVTTTTTVTYAAGTNTPSTLTVTRSMITPTPSNYYTPLV